LLYDFDFAQFYRVRGGGEEDTKSRRGIEGYLARAVMLLRDDYLVISDEVESPETKGRFSWVSCFDLPDIFQLRPGAPEQKDKYVDKPPYHDEDGQRIGQIRFYEGKGDFLTVVAPPKAVNKADAKPYGAIVNGEQVFASQKPVRVNADGVQFEGTYGYARANQLALFIGDKIGLGGFTLARKGGDFGASASLEENSVVGRIVGRNGGSLTVTVPAGFAKGSSIQVLFDGKPIEAKIDGNSITFSFDITQRDGYKVYEIRSQ